MRDGDTRKLPVVQYFTSHNEFAEKRKAKKGNKYLKSALTECALSIHRSKNYLGWQKEQLPSRKGSRFRNIPLKFF